MILAVADAYEAMIADRVYSAGVEGQAARLRAVALRGQAVRLPRRGGLPLGAERGGRGG
jgi:hypothetical protein